MNDRQAWNINLLFLVLIFGFTLASLLHRPKAFSESENRALKQMPQVNARTVLDGSFEADYEDYLTDQFVLRDRWITLRTMAERLRLKQDVHDIYFARDDYLIEKHSGVFDGALAENNQDALTDFAVQLSDTFDSEHLTVMLVPNAVSVLEDRLPAFAAPYDEEVYLEAIQSRMPAGVWFDASAVLKSHSGEEIFYRTDHHWQTLGAFYVFQAWAREKGIALVEPSSYQVDTVSTNFAGTIASKVGMAGRADSIQIYQKQNAVPYALVYNQSEDVRHSLYLPSALDGRDQYAYFFGGNYGLIQTQTRANTGRRLLVIKDSYAHCFAPFLFDYFDEVDLLDLRYFYDSLSEFMQEQQYTDVLFLQNAAGFAQESSTGRLLS